MSECKRCGANLLPGYEYDTDCMRENRIDNNEAIRKRLEKRIKSIESITKNDEDFIFSHYRMELEDLKKILGTPEGETS
jgi:hypothetical protein